MAQVIICCPSTESMTEQDRREIYNLLEWKKRLKNFKKGVDKPKDKQYNLIIEMKERYSK